MDVSDKILISNIALAIYSIGPPFFILLFYKRLPLGHWKQLIYGLLLIGWSIITFSFFTGALDSLQTVEMSSESLKEGVLGSVSLWMFAYPAVVLSIGSNFVSQFFFSWDSK